MDQPEECGLVVEPHRCFLYDCAKDDPTHVHVCYAGDFDFTAGEYTQYRLGLITQDEFNRLGVTRARRRNERPLYAEELRSRSYDRALINRHHQRRLDETD